MAAELAKPDSMGDLDQADEEAEEEEEGNMEQVEESEPCAEQDKEAEQEQEAEERMSLLTEEQKEKSSPSIQLVAGPVQPPVSSGSGANIKVDIEQGPSPRSADRDMLGRFITSFMSECLSTVEEAVTPGSGTEAATQCAAPAPSRCPSSASSSSPSGSS